MTRTLKTLLAMLALALLTACAVNPATGRDSFTGFMSLEDETRVGGEEHPKLVKEFGGAYADPALSQYVTGLGQALAHHVEVRNYAFTFTVLNDDKVNAFALPGGYVYVTRGLMALAENEAELAGVVAHEIGHVIARHTAERYSATMATNLGLMVLGVIGSTAGLPPELGRLAGFGAQAALQGYSREQELEADLLGVRYMTRAGYDPGAMTSFFEKMSAHAELERQLAGKKDDPTHNIMSTHPRTQDRIGQAIQLAKLSPVARPVLRRDEYLGRIDGMVFGDDPSQGVRSGRTFRHPDLRIEFTVPPGFQLFNTPRQVIARGPEKSVILFDMAGQEAARRAPSLADYMTNVWGRTMRLDGVERIDVNGMEAATGKSRVATQGGPRDVRLIAVRGHDGRIFRFAFITHPSVTGRYNVEFRRTTYSFRRLSEGEAAAIRPLKVRVVTAGPGATPKTLAAAMPLGDYALRWFETLNGLRPGQGVRPGSKVKIVSE